MESSPSIPQPVQIVYDDDLSIAKHATGAVCLTDIMPHDVAWLWPGRIPLGNVTLLVADPGVGKSLVALDIAARVSTGRSWPDVGPPSRGGPDLANTIDAPGAARLAAPTGSVLLINIEDHFHNTIRPRLDALGADCSRIMAWTYVSGDPLVAGPHLFALTRDLDRLNTLVCAMRDCRLVVLDPITAFLGDSSDQSSADVWKLLSALASLARKRNFAVLAVSHLRKKEGAAIHRALGSLAFVAAARAVWTVAKDPADAKKRLLLPLKNNLAPDTKGLAFTIKTHEPTQAAVIGWLQGAVEATADTALATTRDGGRPDNERKYAVQWLRTRLSDGPAPVRDIRADADAHGIGYGTLRRAFRELGAEAIKHGPVPRGQWKWTLPNEGAQNRVGEFCAPSQIPDEFAELDSA
jgi:putative DNA primase/helicase